MNERMLVDEKTRRVLACLGDASRFRLVRTLAECERCVGELAVAVGLSQSCTTRHLQALERVGLVEGKREGRRVRFRLCTRAPELERILAWMLSEAGLSASSSDSGAAAEPQRRAPAAAGSSRRVAPRPARRTIAPHGAAPVQPIESDDGGEAAGARPVLRRDDIEDYLL